MINNNFKYKLHGRFKGRKKNQIISWSEFSKYELDIGRDLRKENYTILDIGSGSGENAIFFSQKNKNSHIITCEVFVDGNINLFNTIKINNIKNISLFCGNVLQLLDNINDKEIFDEIWISFPDPWPKLRHHKRRLININFLKRISFFLKKAGKLNIVTDSESYLNLIYENIYDLQKFYFWSNQRVSQWNYSKLSLPDTKFHKKAKKSKRNSIFFELLKI